MPGYRDRIDVEDRRRRDPAPKGEPSLPAAALGAGGVAALARSSPGARAEVMRALQVGHGNASVQAMLRSVPDPAGPVPTMATRVERYAFEAEIPRGPSPRAEPHGAIAGRTDADPGMEETPLAEITALLDGGATPAQAAAPPEASAAAAAPEAAAAAPEGEAGVGATFSLPDIEVPALAEVGKSDAVAATFTYSGSINRGGAQPSGFGVTRSFTGKLTGVTTTLTASTYKVSATLEHPITWQVRSGTGPRSQKDIADETDSDIKAGNYPDVVTALTPNMSDLNGRPPRVGFWAEDLTIKHEKVHADDDKANGPAAMAVTSTWLGTKTASSVGDVTTLLGEVPTRFAAALLAALSTEDGEKHAYGDGAPSYKARAEAIKKKGDKGDYP